MMMKKKTQDLEKIKKKQFWIKFAYEFKFLARPLLLHYSFTTKSWEGKKERKKKKKLC